MKKYLLIAVMFVGCRTGGVPSQIPVELQAPVALIQTICPQVQPDKLVQTAKTCLQYIKDPGRFLACACGPSTNTPTPEPSAATPIPSASPSPTAGAPSPSPTSIPSVTETPYPVTGTCGKPSGMFNAEIHQALTNVRLSRPDLMVAGHAPYRVQATKTYEFDVAVLQQLRSATPPLDGVIDGNCGPWGCDQIAVAKHGDSTAYEEYALLTSGHDFRDVLAGDPDADQGYCTPRGFPLTSTPADYDADWNPATKTGCPCLNRVDVHVHGAPQNPMGESHSGTGDGYLCYSMDTTARFGTDQCGAGGCIGKPDDLDHPNFGNQCEFQSQPLIIVMDGKIDPAKDIRFDAPDPLPYTFRLCGPSGTHVGIKAMPPWPYVNKRGKAVRICGIAGAPDGGTYWSGVF